MKGVQLRADTRAALVREIIQRRRTLEQTSAELCVDVPTLVSWVEEYVADSRFALETRAREIFQGAGLNTSELTDLEFSGSLEQMSFPDVMQMMIMHRRSCIVKLSCATSSGRVWLSSGEVFDAEFEELVGERAFFALLALRQGTFRVLFQSEDRIRSIHRGTQGLILEAAKRSDEAGEMQQRVGGAAQVFSRSDRTLLESVNLRPQDMKTLALFDAKRNLDEILRESPLDEFATLTQVTRLVDEGYLVPCSVKPVALSLPAASQRSFARASLILGDASGFAPEFAPKPLTLDKRKGTMRIGRVVKAMTAVSALAVAFAVVVDRRPNAPYATGIAPVVTPLAVAQAAPAVLSASESSPKEIEHCPSGLVYLAGGELKMGTNSNHSVLRLARPEHAVNLKGFCLSPTEVSVSQYEACVKQGTCSAAKENAYWAQGNASKKTWLTSRRLRSSQCNATKAEREEHPINCVSHKQAINYCASQGLRLPSEAEWEFAARGTQSRKHPWGDDSPSASLTNVCGKECELWHRNSGLTSDFAGTAHAEDDGFSGTAPIGFVKAGATPDGILDLGGNVSEWTSDAPSEYPDAPSAARNATSAVHMIRGAAFNSGPKEITNGAFRFIAFDDTYSPSIGIRCAANAKE